MEKKFFWDDLAEKTPVVQWLEQKETLSPGEQTLLIKSKAGIDLIKTNLDNANDKFNTAFEKLKQNACEIKKATPPG